MSLGFNNTPPVRFEGPRPDVVSAPRFFFGRWWPCRSPEDYHGHRCSRSFVRRAESELRFEDAVALQAKRVSVLNDCT